MVCGIYFISLKKIFLAKEVSVVGVVVYFANKIVKMVVNPILFFELNGTNLTVAPDTVFRFCDFMSANVFSVDTFRLLM